MKIFVDGQHTPTESLICIVVENGGKRRVENLGKLKNHQDVEKAAILRGIKIALENGSEKNQNVVINDSTNAIRWLYSSEDAKEIRELIENSGRKILVCWLPREENLAGIYLEQRLEKVNYSTRSVLGLRKRKRERIFERKSCRREEMKGDKYHCSKHGDIGCLDCEECKENLRKLCKDNNAYLCGDVRDA